MRLPARLVAFTACAGLSLSGCVLTNPQVTLDCVGYNLTADSAQSDTDNTGTGSEIVTFRITDGAGNTLFETDTFPWSVGSIQAPLDIGEPYVTPPLFNPIKMEILARAGGTLTEERVFYTFHGTCDGLTTYSAPKYVPAFSGMGLFLLSASLLLLGGGALRGILGRRRSS